MSELPKSEGKPGSYAPPTLAVLGRLAEMTASSSRKTKTEAGNPANCSQDTNRNRC